MQIFIYEIADNFLHLSQIREGDGEGIRLVFQGINDGKCFLGEETAPIKSSGAFFPEKNRRRGARGLRVRTDEREIPGDSLYFADGKWRSESSEQMCRALLEIARLKDRISVLSSEIEKLNQAVFRTAIF